MREGSVENERRRQQETQRWGPEVHAATSESTGVKFMPLVGGGGQRESKREQ